VASLAVNLVIRTLAFALWSISPLFLPLQIGPVSVFTIILVRGGVLVYALVARFSKHPTRTYTIIALIVLLISLIPDILLLITSDPKVFLGITRPATSILITFHLIDAAIAIVLLTRLAPSKGQLAKEKIR
jgi:hypothetical protein